MADQPYKRPPITEAVIEIRYAEPAELTLLADAAAHFKSEYPAQQKIMNAGVAVGGVPLPPHDALQIKFDQGHRLSSVDQTELVVLWAPSFVVAQLAPYPGWSHFFNRFTRDWKTWKRVVGYRKIARIGVRYINRIDIPAKGPVFDESEYVKVYPQLPPEFGPVVTYGLQAQSPPDAEDCRVTLNSASVLSPLLGYSAILLDIDVAMEPTPPQNDEDIFVLLNKMRVRKNAMFEACLTDRARELFQT
jgi:uncharacterized protein (TIGR04255 family)